MTNAIDSRLTVKEWLLIIFVCLIVLTIQCIGITRPFTGHFASYHSVVAMMARNMEVMHPSQWLYPTSDIIVNGKPGLFLAYYPTAALVAAIGKCAIGGSFELWGRLQAIVFNLLTALLLLLALRREFSKRIALTAVIIYLSSPMTLITGQCFQNEAVALFLLVLSYFILTIRGKDKGPLSFSAIVLAAICLSIAVVSRLHFVLLLPAFIVKILTGDRRRRWINAVAFSAMAVSLPVAWHTFAYYLVGAYDHVQTHLFIQLAAKKTFPHPLLFDLGYYRRVLDVLSGQILTPLVFPFALFGLFLVRELRKHIFWYVSAFTVLVMVFAVPQKVYEHPFYLYPVLPALFVFSAAAFSTLFEAFAKKTRLYIAVFCVIALMAVSARYFLHPIFRFPASDNNIRRVGDYVTGHTDPANFIIAAHGTDPVLLYYCQRKGWGFSCHRPDSLARYFEVEEFEQLPPDKVLKRNRAFMDPARSEWLEYLRGEGASYFVASIPAELEREPELLSYLRNNYKMISDPREGFYFFDVRKHR